MKKGIHVVIRIAMFFILFSVVPKTYASNYSFTGSSPADVFQTSGSNLLTVPSWNQDNWDTIIRPSGFVYNADGMAYTGFIVSANGWIALIPSSVVSVPPYFISGLPTNSLSTYAGAYPLFAPLWDDHSCGLITVNFSGNVLSVKWTIKWDKTNSANFSDLIWMTLNTVTGVVTFNYSNTLYTSSPSAFASIGVTTSCSSSFLSITPDNVPANSTVSSTVEDSLINFKPVDCKYVFTPVFSSLSWTGIIDTLYDNGSNWGNCGPPTCSYDATIGITVSGNMPTVRSNQSVKNLVIDSGATLRIKSGFTLSICGDFINNGTLIAEPGSTISFIGSGTQNITGSFTGANAFANLSIIYISGDVILNNDIDVNGNFIKQGNGGNFNINRNYIKVGGDFLVSPIIGQALSTVEFNGLNNQNFNVGGTHLYNVFVNKPSGNIYLTYVFGAGVGVMNVISLLDLTSGNIVTVSGGVNVLHASASAIQNYSHNSYVDGVLSRAIFSGAVDFPVGDSLVPNQGVDKGYELATINFPTSIAANNFLECQFNIWSAPPPNGPNGPDTCGASEISYSSYPLYDNGFWYFARQGPSFNMSYDVQLHNTGGTNAAVNPYWTVVSAPNTYNPLLQSTWTPVATCNTSSTLQLNERDSFNIPVGPNGSTYFDQIFANAQGVNVGQVSVNDPDAESDFILSPNPIIETNSLRLYSEYSGKINFQLHDISGQIVSRQMIELNHGENLIQLNKGLAKGIYLVRIEGENRVKNLKLFVQ